MIFHLQDTAALKTPRGGERDGSSLPRSQEPGYIFEILGLYLAKNSLTGCAPMDVDGWILILLFAHSAASFNRLRRRGPDTPPPQQQFLYMIHVQYMLFVNNLTLELLIYLIFF